MPLSIGTSLGPYEILAPIGAGGMGEVYRAHDSRLNRDVAIKVLPEHLAADADALARFRREAMAVAALAHPNILVLYDVGAEQEIHYAVMELLEGETLRERLSRGPLAWRKVAEFGSAIAEGLAAAHAKGIVHQDVKPANIFLTSDGRVKILDFGLAQMRTAPAQSEDTITVTEAGTVMGTIGYMSPEQVRGEKAEAASDIFSLGCVLYEMLTGRRAFSGKSGTETMASILRDEPPSAADSGQTSSADLDRVMERCLAKNPAQRFHSAHDLAFALRNLSSSVGEQKLVAAPARIGQGRFIAAAALVLILAAVVFYFWRSRASGGIESLAVLPFVNMGGNADTDYLSDGITDSLIDNLSELPHLRVMSHSAVFRYKGKEIDPRTVGRELGVRAVLTGRVTQRGVNLAIHTELVNVDDNAALWGEEYDRNLMDALAVQNDIAHQIVETLKLRLSGSQKMRMVKRQTDNPEAYQLYLKGRYYAAKFDPENLNKGRDYLRQAIALDPNFALAYDGLSYYYSLLVDWFEPANEAGPKALEAARKALELDPNLAEAHVELAAAHLFYDFDWTSAERELRRAFEINPNYATAHAWNAWYLIYMGRNNEALAEIRKAVQLDPLSAENTYLGAWFLFYSRRPAEGLSEVKKALELDPHLWISYFIQGQCYEQLGRFPEALAALKKSQEILGDNPSPPLAVEARIYALSGRRADALRTLDRLLALSKRAQVSKYTIATVYAALGDKEQAFAQLNQAYQEHSFLLGFLKVDPELDPLRGDPRFPELLRKMKLQ